MNQRILPAAPPVRKLIGPSFVILALGLGSGEIILWPYLVANHGLGIAWAAILGITFQFFINMEIERYALVAGESIFVGIAKIARWAPWWFITSTFIAFGLPGIIVSAATAFGAAVGVFSAAQIAAGGAFLLVLIGFLLSSGNTVYGFMERATRTVIFIGVPLIFLLVICTTNSTDWLALFYGYLGRGDDYAWLPQGIVLATFFGAFAYSGAGGNLNLTQSLYIKEKGYGMGAYAQPMAGLFRRGSGRQLLSLTGRTYEESSDNARLFKAWWRAVNIEHGLVFWFIGSMTMSLLMILAHATVFGHADVSQGISFILTQAAIIGTLTIPFFGILFLIIVGAMLFQTQMGVLDSVSRIIAENVALLLTRNQPARPIHLVRLYAVALWSLIIFGVAVLLAGLHEPRALLVLAAVINGVCMAVHVILTFVANRRLLPVSAQPSLFRRLIIMLAIFVFVTFGLFMIWQTFR